MSVELLLVIVFILLPLIQQLLRAMKERQQSPPQQPASPAPAHRPTTSESTPSTSQVASPPALAVPPVVSALSPASSMAVTSPAAVRRTPGAAMPVSTARRRGQKRGAPGRFVVPRNLQEAIVVMTILGPCRGLAGDDRGDPFRG